MAKLKKLTGRDWPKVKELIESFDTAARKVCADHNELLEIAGRAFGMELEHVPALNEEISGKLPSENRCLVASVGLKKHPVLLSIAILKPKTIVFVHTRESGRTVDQILGCDQWQDIFAGQPPVTSKILIDPTDTTDTYQKLTETIKACQNNWLVDITGGKKVMGATLSAFAFWRRIPVVYLDSREVKGVSKPFSERLAVIENPYDRYGDPLLRVAEDAFNSHQFAAAIEALESLRRTVSVVAIDHQVGVAASIVKSYMLWDRFAHSSTHEKEATGFYEQFFNSHDAYDQFGYGFIDGGVLKANHKFIESLQENYKPSKPSLTDEYRLVDIFCNSRRRAQQNLFDDAVARLYRCAEIAATISLNKLVPKFNPDKADWDQLRRDFVEVDLDSIYVARSKLTGVKIDGLPKTQKNGLGVQISLAAALAEVVKQYPERFGQSLQAVAKSAEKIHGIYAGYCGRDDSPFTLRNQSILAHGTRPLDAELYRRFSQAISQICGWAIGKKRWSKLAEMATFPKMKLVP